MSLFALLVRVPRTEIQNTEGGAAVTQYARLRNRRFVLVSSHAARKKNECFPGNGALVWGFESDQFRLSRFHRFIYRELLFSALLPGTRSLESELFLGVL